MFGPVTAGVDDGGWTKPFAQECGANIGTLDWHSYMYISGTDPVPSDDGLFQSGKPAYDGPTQRNALAGTAAANADFFLGEWNIEGNAANVPREQQEIGAVFGAWWLIQYYRNGLGSAAVWDVIADGTYGLIQNGIINPLGQLLGKAGQTMEGNEAKLTYADFGMAVSNGSRFGVLLGNKTTLSGSPMNYSGTVGLGHWPVNGTGNGTANLWLMTPSDPTGTTSQLTVTAGVTSSFTLPAQSVAIIYV